MPGNFERVRREMLLRSRQRTRTVCSATATLPTALRRAIRIAPGEVSKRQRGRAIFLMAKQAPDRRSKTRTQTKRHSNQWWINGAFILLVLAALVAIGLPGSGLLKRTTPQSSTSAPVYSFEVVNIYPHDEQAFCQGLAFDGKTLFESTGQYGQSSTRRVDLKTGKVETQFQLDPRLFGEGLTLMNDRVIQLTWRQGVGYVYNAKTLQLLTTFSYEGEGWGLTYDGIHLIMSDGSEKLRFLDPVSFSPVKTILVKDGSRSIRQLNELEFAGGQILANIWHSNRIAIIAPGTGNVTGWIDLTTLPGKPLRQEAVLNGIAYHDGRLFVTGKYWPQLFEIKILKK